MFLQENPLCVRHLARGLVEPATDKDHIRPVTGPEDPTFRTGPFQALCSQCHRDKTREDRRSY